MILFDFIINNEHPSLSGHFPDNPIVPGAIIVEKVIQGLSELETPKETHNNFIQNSIHTHIENILIKYPGMRRQSF
jgi:3-hydroxymyristoyl/3-hydroxydecanoyl-(acyl carrier protein) dehydratase